MLLSQAIQVGVSGCLLGQQVRYDAGHKREAFVADVLPGYFEMVAVCPEVAIGLGVPRPPIQLEGSIEAPRAVGVRQRDLDVTDRLRAVGRETASRYAGLSGYILKSKSPSCGMAQVKLHQADGQVRQVGTGIFAAELMRALPLLPVVEERDLDMPQRRANFIERVRAYRRWQELQAAGITRQRLRDFHAAHELLLLARGRSQLTRLQELLTGSDGVSLTALIDEYGQAFMQALASPAPRRGHAAVLAGLHSGLQLEAGEHAKLQDLIQAYARGELPLREPFDAMRRHVHRQPRPSEAQRLYLQFPVELSTADQ